MKKLIFTASDSKFGDFLINHWLKSLKANVNLQNTRIVVLDYGLSAGQLARLRGEKITVMKCKRTGHVTNIRYRDMLSYLKKHSFDQVLSIDSGDIIFQKDFSKLFETSTEDFRAVCEDTYLPFEAVFLKAFAPEKAKEILQVLKDKKMVNAGVLFAPAGKFARLCAECDALMLEKEKFGPDQIAVNFVVHRTGFKLLEKTYNFVITTSETPFYIKNGEFYFKNGEKIAIVHNAGNYQLLRTVRNFGFGKECNKLKKRFFIIRAVLKIVFPLTNLLKKLKK